MGRQFAIHTAIIIQLLWIGTVFAVEPPMVTWSRNYGGTLADWCQAVQQTTDGGYILAGTSASGAHAYSDALLVKTDPNGNQLWNSLYYACSYDDQFLSVHQTTDGGYLLAGDIEPVGANIGQLWLVKVNSGGGFQWEQFYGGSGDERCNDMIPTLDGGYLIIGYSDSYGGGDRDGYAVKINASGSPQWSRTYGGSGHDYIISAVQMTDGSFRLAGQTASFGAGNEDVWLIATDAFGNTLWHRTYGGSGRDLYGRIGLAPDGGFYLTATTESFGAGGRDWWLIHTNSSGDSLWSRTWGTGSWDECYASTVDQGGGCIMAGYTTIGGLDGALIKYDISGNLVWTRTMGGAEYDIFEEVRQTADLGFIVVGSTASLGDPDIDFWAVKTSPEGVAGYVTLENPGPPDWDYRLHWVRGSINRLVFHNVCAGTHGSCCNGASATGWHATDYPDSVVFTSPNPLTSGSLVTFRLYHPWCSGPIVWTVGDSGGYVDGPLPVELLSFTAQPDNERVVLDWKTASETDNDHFEILRNGEFITRVASQGNTATGHEYSWTDEDLENGCIYTYTLISVDLNGTREELGIVEATPTESAATITEYALHQNFPNPFNANTEIEYALRESGHVRLTVYNSMGQLVATPVNANQSADRYRVSFNAGELASGIYLYKIEVNDFIAVKKMVLLK